MKKKRVVVGMSGGVDSSVAAWQLKEMGYDVIGVFMKNWEDDDDNEYCSSRQDWLDVVSVADLINIEIDVVNFSADYKERVFAEFLREYQAGRTPNPDILCNTEIKFNAFLNHAMSLQADLIATGHYARIRAIANDNLSSSFRYELLRARDHSKDQTYFLHRLNQVQLSKTLFPLGDFLKSEVRQIAAKIGLPNASKKDSTGICFIGERPFREFLNRYLPTKPGLIKNDNYDVVGKHIGLSFYTIGQRKGLGIGGQTSGTGEPWFVANKDLHNNILYVVQGHQHPWLLKNKLCANEGHWINEKPLAELSTMTAKTRYRQNDMQCRLSYKAEDDKAFYLNFDQPQWAITPGQSAVIYNNEVCLGGGFISG